MTARGESLALFLFMAGIQVEWGKTNRVASAC